MEEFGTSGIYGSSTMRRKRSRPSRRPRLESQQLGEGIDPSPSSSTPPSDDAVKFSSDENGGGDGTPGRKELSLNQCVSRGSSASGPESEHFLKRSKKDGSFGSYYRSEPGRSANDNKRSSEGVLAPANWRSTSKVSDGMESESSSIDPYGGRYGGESSSSGQKGLYVEELANDNKVKKVKLRVGGVTRTIQANSPPNGTSKGNSQPSDGHRQQHKHNFQENFNGNHSPSERRGGLHGVPWRDFSRGGFGLEKEETLTGKMPGRNSAGKHGAETLRKSKRASKKRVLDGDFDDDDDDEIRYLEKLRTSKAYAGYRDDGEEPSKKQRKLSSISSMENYGASKHKVRSDIASDDKDYEEDEESASDIDADGNHKKQRKESIDTLMEGKREMTLTTRQRALQSSKEASSARGGSLIEFPNGLPPAPPRKQKEKLTDVEQQLKKAEAAQRRRMQVSKYNSSTMNAIVLYVGTRAIDALQAKKQKISIQTVAHTPYMDIFQNLAVSLCTEGRHLLFNSIANQLRYPNSHTHYFSCTMLYLFLEANLEVIQEQITRILFQRLVALRPHPWGLLITFVELIRNPQYGFWGHEFIRCAPEIEQLFISVANSCNVNPQQILAQQKRV